MLKEDEKEKEGDGSFSVVMVCAVDFICLPSFYPHTGIMQGFCISRGMSQTGKVRDGNAIPGDAGGMLKMGHFIWMH